MKDLYTRLRALGFDQAFVRRYLLPDWWQDGLANVEANRALAEISIAQVLGIPVPQLRDPKQPLRLEVPACVRFKRPANTSTDELDAAIALAQRAAEGLVGALRAPAPFAGAMSALELRERVLSRSGRPDLEALLQAAWDHGVAVIPLRHLPPKAKRFTAAAILCGTQRVIVLASGRDGLPWLSFHLAHELGHIFLGHVSEQSPLVVETDSAEPVAGVQDDEADANTFAVELLTGHREIEVGDPRGVTPPMLATLDVRLSREWRATPGIVSLLWGYRVGRLAVANAALKRMGLAVGGADMVRQHFLRHLSDPADLSDTLTRYLELAVGE
jgi:hypothetical protein